MAPIRRYLRISKYSVLECRIYLDNPALAHSWLLNPRDPVLPRVIESIRPYVLPKLYEERERSKKKSTKKKGIKDVVTQDDFEVSLFLTETNTRHSLLTKHKHFRDKSQTKLRSNTNKLIGATTDNPLTIEAEVDAEDDAVQVLQEEDSDEDGAELGTIPLASHASRARVKRQRSGDEAAYQELDSSEAEGSGSAVEIDSDTELPPPKRLKDAASSGGRGGDGDDKKKMAMDVTYTGFAIYGRVLCLVVRRRDGAQRRGGAAKATDNGQPSGQASMENWITSTQIPVGEDIP